MMKLQAALLKLSLIICSMMMIAGCWSSTNIQDQHYVSALGVDYDGENFTLYAQTMNFEFIASTEGQRGNPNNSAYVGKGIGKTLHTAAADLYKSAQLRVDWGHTQAIVVTERAIFSLDSELVDRIYRFPDNRYNVWLFVTQESIEEIFKSDSFYNFTTLRTILHVPGSSYNQMMTMPPIQMFKYLSFVNEPDRISYIPCLGFDNEHWSSDIKTLKLLKITGAYFSSEKASKMIPNEKLQGYRWLNPRLSRTMIIIKDEETSYAVITIDKAKIKIKPKLINGEVKFNIEANYQGTMNEYIHELDYSKMIELAKQEIENEVMAVYRLGLEEQLDLYNLMHSFRMKMPGAWKNMTKNGSEFILTEDSIESFKIKIYVPTNGKYKRQK